MSPTTITIPPTVTAVAESQTTIVPGHQTEWIQVGQVKPINYYLSLLEANGTQPYLGLAKELRKLPDVTNATAVAKITHLALNATNLEVKEAFELMMDGGTPDPRDFTYAVPSWNTELQVLYWLACQNEFKKDDTLALTIAMVNGLWVTMGDEQVKVAVRKDTSDVLSFFRETNEIQKARGHHELERYPLEAKVTLTWTGSITPLWGHHGLSSLWLSRGYITSDKERGYVHAQIGLKGYRWNNVNVNTLRDMRAVMLMYDWVSPDVGKTVSRVEDYFYFKGMNVKWEYADISVNNKIMQLDNETCLNNHIFNNNAQLRKYLNGEKVTGGCADEASFIDAWCKSWGIASTALWHQEWDESGNICGHYFVIYYDPSIGAWKADNQQLGVLPTPLYPSGKYLAQLYIFHPPVVQGGYLRLGSIDDIAVSPRNMFYMPKERMPFSEIQQMFSRGVAISQMKQWLLYS
jgi:hypothetical protein